jgi:hypothetical protein
MHASLECGEAKKRSRTVQVEVEVPFSIACMHLPKLKCCRAAAQRAQPAVDNHRRHGNRNTSLPFRDCWQKSVVLLQDVELVVGSLVVVGRRSREVYI